MALSEEEQSRLDALERSLLSSTPGNYDHMPEAERTARPEHPDPFEALSARMRGGAAAGRSQRPGRARGSQASARPAHGATVQQPADARSSALRWGVAALLVAAGVALYGVAFMTQTPWYGALGFVLVVAAIAWWLRGGAGARAGSSSSPRSGTRLGDRAARGSGLGPGRHEASSSGAGSPFMKRLENRWEARRNAQGR